MKTKIDVLFSSAGRRVELINCFRADAGELGLDLRVLAVDADPGLSAACRAADKSFPVPACTRPDFIPRLLEICSSEGVRLLVPTIDTELEVLAAHRELFAKIGTEVAVSSPEVVRLARNKMETAVFLASCGVQTPKTAALRDFLEAPAGWPFPVILKPVGGSSSIGLQIVRAPSELPALRLDGDGYIAQELRAGREYTVNMFFDRGGKLRCAAAHRRIETRGGEVSKGVTERVPALETAARLMAGKLAGARGALCFQAIVSGDGAAAVFEINARFGGGFPLSHRAGAAFPRWLLEEAAGRECGAHDRWRDGVTMLRYDAAVFVEPADQA